MKGETENTDRLKEEMMKSTKKRCRKLQTGGVYFRPTLNNLGKTWEFWELVIKSKEGKKNMNGSK